MSETQAGWASARRPVVSCPVGEWHASSRDAYWRAVSCVAGLCILLLAASCGSGSSTVNPLDPSTAKADITRAYSTVTNFSNGELAPKTSSVQDGSSLSPALSEALSSQLSKSATGARVQDVNLLSGTSCTDVRLSSPCASVTYYILGPNGTPIVKNASNGMAVYKDGKWLVAKSTTCNVLGLFYLVAGRKGLPEGC